jgi:hypothetical protein
LASRSINNLIESLEELTQEDVQQILNIINETENKDHYDGSGWADYKNHISFFLKKNGF